MKEDLNEKLAVEVLEVARQATVSEAQYAAEHVMTPWHHNHDAG